MITLEDSAARKGTASPEVLIRELKESDLKDAVGIYVAANPKSLLTSFGFRQVLHYLTWQLKADHMAAAIAAESNGELAGFLLMVRNNDLPGYLKKNAPFLLLSFLKNATVLATPLFRARAAQCMKCLVRPPRSWKGETGTVRVLCIAVHPQHQGRGLGGQLLRSAEETAFSGNHKRAELTVNPLNSAAIRFYERCGWKKLSVGGQWAGTMQKHLS